MPWPEVLAEAQRLHLAFLFHLGLHVSATLRAVVPHSVAEALNHSARVAAARTVQLEQACAAATAAASSAGIPVLILKGLALGALVYPPAVTRPMADMDLLVTQGNRGRLTEVLHSLGYRNDLRGKEDFYPPNAAYSIDVQTGLLNTTRVPARGTLWPASFDELWARGQAFMLAGIPVRTLGPEDTVAHLAVHAVHHHGLTGALWKADLLACLKRWPDALDKSESLPPAVRRSLWYCLEVLSACGQDPVPEIRAALRPSRLFPGEVRVLTARTTAEIPQEIRYVLTLICLPGWKSKAAFLRQILFPQASAFTDGFEDAGRTCPRLGQHWRVLRRLWPRQLMNPFAGQP